MQPCKVAALDIREYLQQWYECCPDVYKGFVQQVMAELGVTDQNASKNIASANWQATNSQ